MEACWYASVDPVHRKRSSSTVDIRDIFYSVSVFSRVSYVITCRWIWYADTQICCLFVCLFVHDNTVHVQDACTVYSVHVHVQDACTVYSVHVHVQDACTVYMYVSGAEAGYSLVAAYVFSSYVHV